MSVQRTMGAATGVLAAALIAPFSAQASPAAPPLTTVVGTRKPLGAGSVWSWVRKTRSGEVVDFGLSFDEAALAKLGPKQLEVPLPLPAEPAFPFRTAVVNWNPHGHPPVHIYDVPHFDFHFYRITEDERMAIAPSGPQAVATPAPGEYPQGFFVDNVTVPMMGKHYIPASAPEFHGHHFTASPIYGFYGGRMIFVESMVTTAYLKTKPQIIAPYPQPLRYPVAGEYPTIWSVHYDRTAHRYDVGFSRLIPRLAETTPTQVGKNGAPKPKGS